MDARLPSCNTTRSNTALPKPPVFRLHSVWVPAVRRVFYFPETPSVLLRFLSIPSRGTICTQNMRHVSIMRHFYRKNCPYENCLTKQFEETDSDGFMAFLQCAADRVKMRAFARKHETRTLTKLEERLMDWKTNVRPETMARIETPAQAEAFIAEQVEALRAQIGEGKVLLALSGGVDSSVVAALLIRAVGKQLTCIHVNHGLMRKGESEQVIDVFEKQLGANLIYVDATDRFLDKLAGVSDPETKRKIIGGEFIRVFEEESAKLSGISFLAQGTIYPDILESDGIKAHHNVGGLPEDVHFELVEPVKLLFKDEVRVVGRALGLPESMVNRQPFPGPGLGVRCVGAITRERLAAVRESDAILREEFEKAGLAGKVWQYFTIVPDFKSTGIRDGKRTFDWPVVLRAVNTRDAMRATVEEVPWPLLEKITARITSEVPGVNRVLYDLTPKPTGTIEWE